MPERLYFTDSDEANALIATEPLALLVPGRPAERSGRELGVRRHDVLPGWREGGIGDRRNGQLHEWFIGNRAVLGGVECALDHIHVARQANPA